MPNGAAGPSDNDGAARERNRLVGLYVSRLLRDHLGASAVGSAGSREELSGVLLVTDIADSTAISERFANAGTHGAEHLRRLLDRYFGGVFAIVERYAGDTIHLEGDAVTAFWRDAGDPRRAATLAAQAALSLREAFRDWRPEAGIVLRHRVSLVAGDLSASGYSTPRNRGFFVLTGKTVKEAAWISQQAPTNQVTVGASLADRLSPLCSFEPVGPLAWRLIEFKSGEPLPVPGGEAVQDESASGLGREFLPSVVIERIDAGHFTWLAEFRIVSVAYVQLAGMDPERPESAAAIQRAIAAIDDVLVPLGAIIAEVVVGDKGAVVVVACGLPGLGEENIAMRAVESARRIRAALQRLSVASSIGVATGRAFCGDVGNQTRRTYLTSGLVMHYGARLMQAACNEILLEEQTACAVANRFQISEPKSILIKGRKEPMLVYSLGEPREARFEVSRPATALYGREREMREIERMLDLAENRVGRAYVPSRLNQVLASRASWPRLELPRTPAD